MLRNSFNYEEWEAQPVMGAVMPGIDSRTTYQLDTSKYIDLISEQEIQEIKENLLPGARLSVVLDQEYYKRSSERYRDLINKALYSE